VVTALPTANVRIRNIRRGRSGAAARRSLRMNATPRASAAASTLSVSGSAQPRELVSVSAYTKSITAPVAENAPAMSKGRRPSRTTLSRRTSGTAIRSTAATGALTKKIHGQLKYDVRTPPTRTPTAAPLPEAAPQIPSAMLRSRPSAKVVISRERPAGASSAPPRPWSPRNATSEPRDPEGPHRTELTAKRAIPAAKTLRRPRTSASLPPSSRNPPKTIAYAVTTHSRPDCVKPRSVSIDGSATFTIATSRITMNCATTMSASAAQGLVGSSRRRIAETDIYSSSQSLIYTTIAGIHPGTGYTSDMGTTTESPLAKAGVKPPRELVSSPSFLLKRLGFSARDRASAAFEAAGSSAYHSAVLAVLEEGDRETQATIADALAYDRSYLVGILDRLEGRGRIQ